MPNNVRPHYIEDELAVRLPKHEILSTGIISPVLNLQRVKYQEKHAEITSLYTENKRRLKDLEFIQKLTADINNIITEDGVDFTNYPELQERLNQARELGVTIPEGKVKFTKAEQTRLMQNIDLSSKSLTDMNLFKLKELEKISRELDHISMMIREASKTSHQTNSKIAANIK
jgi:hypothetical protein